MLMLILTPVNTMGNTFFYRNSLICGNSALYQLKTGPILCPILKGRNNHGYEDQPDRRCGCTCSFSRCPQWIACRDEKARRGGTKSRRRGKKSRHRFPRESSKTSFSLPQHSQEK